MHCDRRNVTGQGEPGVSGFRSPVRYPRASERDTRRRIIPSDRNKDHVSVNNQRASGIRKV